MVWHGPLLDQEKTPPCGCQHHTYWRLLGPFLLETWRHHPTNVSWVHFIRKEILNWIQFICMMALILCYILIKSVWNVWKCEFQLACQSLCLPVAQRLKCRGGWSRLWKEKQWEMNKLKKALGERLFGWVKKSDGKEIIAFHKSGSWVGREVDWGYMKKLWWRWMGETGVGGGIWLRERSGGQRGGNSYRRKKDGWWWFWKRKLWRKSMKSEAWGEVMRATERERWEGAEGKEGVREGCE